MTVTTTCLEMLSPADLRPKELADPRFQVVQAREPQWPLNRFLYSLVGDAWSWRTRAVWSDDEWAAYVESPAVRTYLAWYDGSPAGYFELQRVADDTEIRILGLTPRFLDRHLGGPLLTCAIREAWRDDARRVWVHTCTLDHPRALPNYQARGFTVYRTETK